MRRGVCGLGIWWFQKRCMHKWVGCISVWLQCVYVVLRWGSMKCLVDARLRFDEGEFVWPERVRGVYYSTKLYWIPALLVWLEVVETSTWSSWLVESRLPGQNDLRRPWELVADRCLRAQDTSPGTLGNTRCCLLLESKWLWEFRPCCRAMLSSA